MKAKTEIGTGLNEVFSITPNTFYLNDISGMDRSHALMEIPAHIIKTNRIGLNQAKDNSPTKEYFKGKFRFIIYPHLKLKDKTRIANDMRLQYPDLTVREVNKLLGSEFLD